MVLRKKDGCVKTAFLKHAIRLITGIGLMKTLEMLVSTKYRIDAQWKNRVPVETRHSPTGGNI